jgi:hypothetical protein
MTALEAAQKLVADLEAKRVRLVAKGIELGDERANHCAAAHRRH